jgi:hypothetical protein
MSVVRLEALKALTTVIEDAVPELVGKVKVAQAPPGEVQTYPTLSLIPGTWKYDPAQELEHATIGDPDAGVVVFNVGSFSTPLQLRLMSATLGERWAIEQKLVDLFMNQEQRPGILVVPVTTCPDLSDWIAAFEYDSDQWLDAAAFDRKYESLVIVNAIVPALVVRTGVYEISDLVLGLTEEMTKVFTTDTMVPPDVELVLINEDGTLSPYP